MSITLGFVLLGLLLALWGYSTYLSWKVSEGVSFAPIKAAPFVTRYVQTIRLVRRGWYGALLHAKAGLVWSGKRLEKGFVKIFPSAAPAFAKRDELTGLHTGPSSYFLKTISEDEKRLSRSKNVV